VKPALFESRLLDRFHTMSSGHNITGLRFDNRHTAEEFWHSYLVYRVRNETDPTVAHYVDIRQTAKAVCREMGADLLPTIDTVCWLALEHSLSCRNRRHYWEPRDPRPGDCAGSNPGDNLLSTAAYFNLIPLAKQLLLEGHCPTSRGASPTDDDRLFPPPMQLAALAGNTEMLELFQQHIPENEELPTKYGSNWHGKIAACSLIGAVRRADMEILKLALYPPSRSTPNSTDLQGQPFGHVDPSSSVGRMMIAARYRARSPEVHAYLLECLGGEIKLQDLSDDLEKHAGAGNLTMVRYLLDMGVPMTTPRGYEGCRGLTSALVAACYRCHEDVVDLLLERGADPNFGYEKPVGMEVELTPLTIAAASGSLTIVRKLLDHGAHIDVPAEDYMTRLPALYWAIAIEHTAMVQLLLERGASLEGKKIEAALELAEELDLDSMAEILRGLGVTIKLRIKSVAPWLVWAVYPRPIG